MGVLDAATERGTTVRFAAGQAIVHQGDTGRHCSAIVEGEAVVTAVTFQGATVVLARRGPGALIGEFSALDGAPRSATVRVVGEVTAIAVQGDDLEQILHDHPDLAIEAIRRLSRLLRSLTERYSQRRSTLVCTSSPPSNRRRPSTSRSAATSSTRTGSVPPRRCCRTRRVAWPAITSPRR
ncbi:MAG: cyclic nucleotide-binding domain-containing protein [Ilumatobacter sp.]|nr:cyclic nucleotide-binding domain-containing protein [Ilumatobacter sp.]